MTLRESIRFQKIANAYPTATGAMILAREGRRKPRGWKQYDFHPLADVIPRHRHSEIRTLAADILSNGSLIMPLTIYEGKILDGRARAFIADKLSTAQQPIIVTIQMLDEDTEPEHLLVQRNVLQRHMEDTQVLTTICRYKQS